MVIISLRNNNFAKFIYFSWSWFVKFGLIHDVLEDFVVKLFGKKSWQEILWVYASTNCFIIHFTIVHLIDNMIDCLNFSVQNRNKSSINLKGASFLMYKSYDDRVTWKLIATTSKVLSKYLYIIYNIILSLLMAVKEIIITIQ